MNRKVKVYVEEDHKKNIKEIVQKAVKIQIKIESPKVLI
jgi:hypothetical protein